NIDIVFPEPVLAGTGDLMYLPEKANHPNAAILFLAWSGTQGAQNLLDSVDFTGHPLVEGNDVTNILKGKKISYPTWESSARSHEVLAEILRTMGMPVVQGKKKKK
ncbi:MAG: hypothetical protein U1D67_08965, partial [Dehalococcoidia bacterium]|nr:hypothetical protein [Dehalococcoidia bacterium]